MSGGWDQLERWATELERGDRVRSLRARAADQVCRIAFMGEFSRGKSSLVNALADFDLLPVDVRPTTAGVVVVRAGRPGQVLLHSANATASLPLSPDALRHAQTPETGGLASDGATWLEVATPEFTLEAVHLVDTPGVNDLGDTSPEIVRRLLPFVDLVVYVLDASVGLTASETAFLSSRAELRHAPPSLVVANKIDRLMVEDDEEREEVLAELRAAIEEVLGADTPLVPVSTRSGEGLGHLKALLETHRDTAVRRRRDRLEHLAREDVTRAALTELESIRLDQEQARRELEQLERHDPALRLAFERFRAWAREAGERPLATLLGSSLANLEEQIRGDVEYQAQTHPDPVTFAEHGLAHLVEHATARWVDRNVTEIVRYLQRHQQAVAKEAERAFGDQLRLPQGVPLDLRGANEREAGVIEITGGRSSALSRYAPAAIGSVVVGLIAAPLSVLGFAAGLAVGEQTERQRVAMQRAELHRGGAAFVRRAVGALRLEIERQLARHFDAFDLALTEALSHRLETRRRALATAQDRHDDTATARINRSCALTQILEQLRDVVSS